MRSVTTRPSDPHLPIRTARLRLPQGQLFWREVGHGASLLCLHGSWQDGEQWQHTLADFSREYHCLVPDLLGFGDSERPKHHYSIALEVECLNAYLDALGLDQVYLVGHSLGGWIAASLALHSQRVQGLVLIAPEGVTAPNVSGRWWRSRWLAARFSPAAALLRLMQPVAGWVGLKPWIQRSLAWRRQLQQSSTACQLLFQRRHAEIQAELLNEQLPQLAVPTLVICGEQDSADVAALSQTYAQLMPQAKLDMLPGTSDELLTTQAATLTQRIQAWLCSW